MSKSEAWAKRIEPIKAPIDFIAMLIWWAASLAVLLLIVEAIVQIWRFDIPLLPSVPLQQLIYAAGTLWLTKR